MQTCHFCGRSAPGQYALTSRKGNPKNVSSWARHVLPLCGRCRKALAGAGLEGRELKGTEERWYAGHVVGRFESKGAPIPR